MIRKIITGDITSNLLPNFLNIMMLGFGTTIISLIIALNYTYNQKVAKDLKGADMVVGAKGSPLQLVLSSVYHFDQDNGNIPYEEVLKLADNPYIKSITPLYMGDYYKGHKIIGTDKSYLEKFNAGLAEGSLFENDFDIVIGSKVAHNNHLSLGESFSGNHGHGQDAYAHHDFKYTVTGILEETETVLDYLILCNLNTTDILHRDPDDSLKTFEITSALIELNDPEAIYTLPDEINNHTSLLAAVPAFEINKLSHITGLGTTLLEGIAWSIVFLSALSIFITVFRSVRARRFELAIMRMMGATRFTLIKIILLETWLTTGIGYVLGLAVSRFGIWILQHKVLYQTSMAISYQLTPPEKWLFPILIIFSTLSVAIPMVYAFRLNISRILSKE